MWNSKERMTKKEYLKYNNPEAFDLLGNLIKPGDTVVINNNNDSIPRIGVVNHFTECGQLAIVVTNTSTYLGKPYIIEDKYYRLANKVVKIKDGYKGNNKNKS